jgi:hypothetical protein
MFSLQYNTASQDPATNSHQFSFVPVFILEIFRGINLIYMHMWEPGGNSTQVYIQTQAFVQSYNFERIKTLQYNIFTFPD